jgi:hypothetical protein
MEVEIAETPSIMPHIKYWVEMEKWANELNKRTRSSDNYVLVDFDGDFPDIAKVPEEFWLLWLSDLPSPKDKSLSIGGTWTLVKLETGTVFRYKSRLLDLYWCPTNIRVAFVWQPGIIGE